MTQGCYLLFGELLDEEEATLGARSYKGSFNSWSDINDYINKDYKCFAWMQVVDSCTMEIVDEQLNEKALHWNEINKLEETNV